MSRLQHSKSSLFLMELIFNLLLFCVLCGCGLLFFIKSDNITNDTTTLSHAVSISSSIAGIYENGDGSLSGIIEFYPDALLKEDCLTIYFDDEYTPCTVNESAYYVNVHKADDNENKVSINFYDDEKLAYSINACYYKPSTPTSIKEVDAS